MSSILKSIIFIVLLTSCNDNFERKYHSNGQLSLVGQLIDGKKEGDWIGLDENGDTLHVTPYLNNKQHGRVRYYQEGRLHLIWTYENGIGHGEHLSFYPNGALESKSIKINGNQPEEVSLFYPTGELKQISRFQSFVQYYKNGQVESEFDNGLKGHITYYDSIGNMTLKITVLDGQMVDTVYQR